MRTLTAILLSLIVIFSGTKSSEAQTIELLAGNTLNGALNGTLLGGATMGLQNSSDFRPLQVGLGLGTLYGLGMGAYDIVSGEGQQVLVSGLFNDGDNTSIIVLLDTFYGAAAGAVIGTSIMLIADEPIVEGLQYGASTGAWMGFGVGLIDVFAFSERNTRATLAIYTPSSTKADGLVGIQLDDKTSIGLVSPSIIQTLKMGKTSFTQELSPTVEVVNLKFNF